MKKILSLLLIFALIMASVAGCSPANTTVSEAASPDSNAENLPSPDPGQLSEPVQSSPVPAPASIDWNQEIKFTGMHDASLLPYIEDTVYSQLVRDLDSTDYFVEDVSAVFVSQEYIDEVSYNSQTNVFFGYSLADLDAYFEGTRYVFTLGEDGQTTVVPLQEVEDTTYTQLFKNVAIGTGVILVCVTVSAVTAGVASAPAVSMIFAVAAKTATTCALSGALISGVSSAVVKGYQTGDVSEALKAGASSAGQGYKWGAITGALTGGAGEAFGLLKATGNGLTINEAAMIQKESGYPLNLIRQFHSAKEYQVFRDAGLHTQMINGKLALVREDIDLYLKDEFGRTNLQRMKEGLAPIDSSGKSFQLHHIGQKNDGTLAILTEAEHDNPALHGFVQDTEIDRSAFKAVREAFWKTMAKALSGGA